MKSKSEITYFYSIKINQHKQIEIIIKNKKSIEAERDYYRDKFELHQTDL